jgi:hypothetical protein
MSGSPKRVPYKRRSNHKKSPHAAKIRVELPAQAFESLPGRPTPRLQGWDGSGFVSRAERGAIRKELQLPEAEANGRAPPRSHRRAGRTSKLESAPLLSAAFRRFHGLRQDGGDNSKIDSLLYITRNRVLVSLRLDRSQRNAPNARKAAHRPSLERQFVNCRCATASKRSHENTALLLVAISRPANHVRAGPFPFGRDAVCNSTSDTEHCPSTRIRCSPKRSSDESRV